MKLASKITLSVTVVSLLALPLLVGSFFYFSQAVLQKKIATNYLQIAQQKMQTIDHDLYTAFRDIQMIAANQYLQAFMEQHTEHHKQVPTLLTEGLEEQALLSGPWDQLTVIDKDGAIIMSTDKRSIDKTISEYPASVHAYQQARNGKAYYSDLVLPQRADRATVIFAAPIISAQGNPNVNGVVIGHFAWPVVQQILDETLPPAIIHLLNKEGTVIAASTISSNSTFKDRYDKHEGTTSLLASYPWGKAVIMEKSENESGPILAVYYRQHGLFSYQGSGWTLCLEIPLKNALAPVNQLAKNVATVALFGLIVLIAVLYYIGKVLARPIESLTQTVEKVSRGDLTVKARVSTKDEVGTLAQSFNRMTETLQKNTVSKDYVENILETMCSTLIVVNPDTSIAVVNHATLRLLGYQEKELLDQPIERIVAGIPTAQENKLDYLIAKGSIANTEVAYISKQGQLIPMLFSCTTMLDGQGNIQGIVCAATDIRERKKREEKLRSTSRALSATHASSMLITHADNEQQLFKGVCRNIVQETGYQFAWVGLKMSGSNAVISPAAWAGEAQSYLEVLLLCQQASTPTNTPEAMALHSKTAYIEMNIKNVSSQQPWSQQACKCGFESVIAFPLLRGKTIFAVLAIYSSQVNAFTADEIALLGKLADDLAYGATAIQIKQSNRLANKKLNYLALYDSLTTLPNRAMMLQTLNQALDQLHQQDGALAVLFIDLDDFKLVNDTLGHAAGDELLCQVAKRLQNATREADIIARQGGDEFIVLLTKYGKQLNIEQFEENISMIAQRILDALQQPFQIQNQDSYISASIGISLHSSNSCDAAQLIQYADNAMYRAKELGRNNYQYFCNELSERQKMKMSLATMLHKALEQQEFRLHYQPLIDLNNGRMVGVEALIRWERKKGQLISPADFLPVAEDTGLILPIGDWVIQEACNQLRKWADQGMTIQIAINLSARQMWHGDITDRILQCINESEVSKNMLEIEVTESAMFADPERMEKTLQQFQENNFNISLDDFGTGYSSLDRLKRLPFTKIKIDKSFVDGIPNDEDDIAIISATIEMARSLKIYSLAEGIETAQQYHFLKSLGCRYGQGYYFSKPVPAKEIEQMFKEKRSWALTANDVLSAQT